MKPLLLLALLPGFASACIVLGPAEMAEEQALIEWDPTTKLQRFVRHTNWRHSVPAVFLVPVPSRPKVETREVDWSDLFRSVAPKKVARRIYAFIPGLDLLSSMSRPADEAAAAGTASALYVTEIDSGSAGGYFYKVLRANDAATLAAYLKKNGFAAGDDRLREWLDPYVSGDWHLVAFRLDPKTPLGAVEIAFKTERPFFPYREPKGATRSTALDLFVKTPTGVAVEGLTPTFRGREENGWITHFHDTRESRPRTDLTFTDSAETVVPAPVVDQYKTPTVIPVGTPTALLLGGIAFGWNRRKKSTAR